MMEEGRREKVDGLPARRRPGLTLLELVAASTIAAMLLAAIAGVLAGIARQQRALLRMESRPAWQVRLADQLRWDIQNARRVTAAPDRLRLVGYGARDFATGRATQRRAEITYVIWRGEGRKTRWLVRRERHLDEFSDSAWRGEVVCRDVAALLVRRAYPEDFGSMAPSLAAIQREGTTLRNAPVPPVLRVVLLRNDGEPIVDEFLYLRGGR